MLLLRYALSDPIPIIHWISVKVRIQMPDVLAMTSVHIMTDESFSLRVVVPDVHVGPPGFFFHCFLPHLEMNYTSHSKCQANRTHSKCL